MENEMYIIVMNTLSGLEVSRDDENNPDPEIFESRDDAFATLFSDAFSGVEGNGDYDSSFIIEMGRVLKEGDLSSMEAFMESYPEANYYGEHIMEYYGPETLEQFK